MKWDWVVFDLDGTLIESEQIWAEVRRAFVVENGGSWNEAAQGAMMGMRTSEWAAYVHEALGVSLAPATIAKRVVERIAARLSQDVPALPGAEPALERIASAFTLGLATSSAAGVAEAVLSKTGWRRFFSVVVSADTVARGKPAPDVYLRTLELLRADSARTVAIEDSANGIRSAYAAGLAVIAIPNQAYPPGAEALALARRVLATLNALDAETIRTTLPASDG